ncbi:MAG: SpoIIE family protein phosphatase [Eubacteriales bacterium]
MDIRKDPGTAVKEKNALEQAWRRYIDKLQARGQAGRVLLVDGALLVLAFLFARTEVLFGALPLGLALLCAANRSVFFIAAGLLAGCIFLGPAGVVYGCVFAIALLLRFLFSSPSQDRRLLPRSEGLFRELPQLRMASACIGGFLTGLYQAFVGGVSVETLLFGLGMVIGSTVICGALAGAFEYGPALLSAPLRRGVAPGGEVAGTSLPAGQVNGVLWAQMGLLVLCFFVSLSLTGIAPFGLQGSYCFASLVAIYISRRLGALRGAAAGLVTAAGATTLYAPAFGLLGLLVGLMWQVGGIFALGLGVAAGVAWSSYAGGYAGVINTLPEMAVSAMLLYPFLPRAGKSDKTPAPTPAVKTQSAAAVQELQQHRTESEEARLGRLSEAFASLSKLFFAYTEVAAKPDLEHCREVCESVCERICGPCEARMACWQSEERPMVEAMARTAERLRRGQALDADCLPPVVNQSCADAEAILEGIREAFGQRKDAHNSRGQEEALALDYDLVATMLRDTARTNQSLNQEDAKLAVELRRAMQALGIEGHSVSVVGGRQKNIAVGGVSVDGEDSVYRQMHREFEKLCDCRLTSPAFDTVCGTSVMEMTTAKAWCVDTAHAARSAESAASADSASEEPASEDPASEDTVSGDLVSGDLVSGDTVRFFEGRDGYFYALLSDGMGCGSEAAVTSGLCAVFLEKMLLAGATKSTALKMLNHMLRSTGTENSATVDLLEIDLFDGSGIFLKSGAAPSYIKRGTQLFRIRSKTLPVGLMKNPDIERIQFRMEEGDVIVMLSDGISQSMEDAPWLLKRLSQPWSDDLQAEADELIRAARESATRTDDATVVLLQLHRIPPDAE